MPTMTIEERAAKTAYDTMVNRTLGDGDFHSHPWESQNEEVRSDWIAAIKDAIREAVEHEREECVNTIMSERVGTIELKFVPKEWATKIRIVFAKAIRARGQQHG